MLDVHQIRRPFAVAVSLPFLLAAGPWSGPVLGAPAPGIDGSDVPRPRSEERVVCMGYVGGDDVIPMDPFEGIHGEQDFQALRARLLDDPVASASVWQRFLVLRSGSQNRREALDRYGHEKQWGPAPAKDVKGGVDAAEGGGKSELEWLDLWRRENPWEQDAWCRWALGAEAEVRSAAVIGEMEVALATDPQNGSLRHCLLDALYRAGDATRAAELEAEGGPPGPGTEWLDFLPQPLRGRYAFEVRQSGLEGDLEVLRRARLERPDDVRIELVELDLQRLEAGEERRLEIDARFREIATGPQSVSVLGEVCSTYGWAEDEVEEEACWDRFAQRVLKEGFHLASTVLPPKDERVGLERWDYLIYRARARLVEGALASRDLNAAKALLLDGPGYGFAQLWRRAFNIAEGLDEEAPGTAELRGGLCRVLEGGARAGRLNRPVVEALTTCPVRADDLLRVLENCELEGAAADLRSAALGRRSELPAWTLGTLRALPPAVRAEEIERRLAHEIRSDSDSDEAQRVALERQLTPLLLQLEGWERLRHQGLRLVAREGRLGPEVRGWLDRVDSVADVDVVPILRELVARVPEDRMLRLRLAIELLKGGSTEGAVLRPLIAPIASDPSATVRERAEASYLLGRVALLEGRPEAATPLLARFYEARIEHAGCPASFLFCDRDYMLHLLAVGDAPRLDAYWRFRDEVYAAHRAKVEARNMGHWSPILLAKQGWPVLMEDELLKRAFLDPGCGLPGAVPHLESLAGDRPDDSEIQERLERERRRSCVRGDGPFPFAQSPKPFEGFPPWGWLLAAEYPGRR